MPCHDCGKFVLRASVCEAMNRRQTGTKERTSERARERLSPSTLACFLIFPSFRVAGRVPLMNFLPSIFWGSRGAWETARADDKNYLRRNVGILLGFP